MELIEAILESWDRQARIVHSVAERIDESNRAVKPSEDGMPLDLQLAHIHAVRRYWLSRFSPEHAKSTDSAFEVDWVKPIQDLGEIRKHLDQSAKAVRDAAAEGLKTGAPAGGYDHPILFLHHMIWHEGWHVGLIFLGLRLAGQEPPEEWEEEHVWGEWRVE